MVREALGPEAVILSNRTVDGAVEILALASEDMSSLAAPAVEKESLDKSAAVVVPEQGKRDSGAAQPPRAAEPSHDMSKIMDEIRSMRGVLESQLAEIAWSGHQQRNPARTAALREMLSAGFSASLARYMIERSPADQQSSELMHAPGVDVVGPLPQEIQQATVFSGAVCTASAHHDAAAALLAWLASDAADDARRRHGMQPVRAARA